MLLSVIIPVYNEADLVSILLEKICAIHLENGMRKEIIIVDDGSTDTTRIVIDKIIERNYEVQMELICHKHNRGKGAAVRSGILSAKGDIIIIQDADLEYNPEDIREVVRPILNGEAHVVYGSRILYEIQLRQSNSIEILNGKHPDSYLFAYIGGVAITMWTNFLTGAKLTDEPTCYKCFRKHVLSGITIERNDFSWEPEVTMKLLHRGINIIEVPVAYYPRRICDGKKINWKHGFSALLTVWKYR